MNSRSFFLAPMFLCLVSFSVQAQMVGVNDLALQLIDDVKVASLDPGVVEMLAVKAGDQVALGDPLLRLDDVTYQAETQARKLAMLVAESEARNDINLRYSRKTLEVNEKQLEKSLAAVRQFAKSISETEIDRLRLEREQSALSIEQAEMQQESDQLTAQLKKEELRGAEIRLQRRQLTAPLAGMVTEVGIQVGESVTAGQPVIRIINLNRLRVKAKLDRRFVLDVKPDLEATFEIKLNGKARQFPGKVVFVSPEIQPTAQTFSVWVDIENPDTELLPGLKGTLKLGL